MLPVCLSTFIILIHIGLGYSRLNVLFLVADDMRPQLGAYDGQDFPSPTHPKMYTPNLDSLAARSLLLKRAHVQQAICSPSRTSLLTGRRPDTTHVYDLHSYFRKVGGNFTTLPEYFKQNGYITAGMGKIFHPGHASGHDDPVSWTEPYFHGVANFESKNNSWLAVPDNKLTNSPLIDKQVADHAMKTLQSVAKSGKNFFVAVGFHKPHLPFVFPASFMNKYYPQNSIRLPDNPYAPVNMPRVAWQHFAGLREYADIAVYNASGAINTTFPVRVVLELRRAYYSAISWVDSLVGEIISSLETLGLSNNTIVSFWGDHGFQLGEHGEWCKRTNFELSTHAPMMIHIPGMTDSGIQTEQLTEFVDLFPTLAQAAGLMPLPLCPEDSSNIDLCRDGKSLLPLIKHPEIPVKTAAFSQYPRDKNVMGYSIRTEKYRYTEWAKFKYYPKYKPDWNRLSGVELYDHTSDPEENYNRIFDKRYNDIIKELSKTLHKGWRKL